ncbi:MAG: zinc ABC transporter substrate-binding protein [Proteobacteria bacterium]|nr:zinc ABC transporter substrate-binding protein [Pseudomonadota bacterium]
MRGAERGEGRRIVGAALVGVLLAAACAPRHDNDARPLVVVSVAPQRFVVRAVADELVRVEVMIPPGASPHTYEPTLAQVRALEEAALYVKVGHPKFPFEAAWLDQMLAEVPGLPVLDASAGLQLDDREDPHLWVAPHHVDHMAVQVEAALERVLPAERAALRRNLVEFRGRIAELDRAIERMLGDAEGAKFFVFHPAWGHFAEAYGLRQVAVEHEHKEPDPHELVELIERAREARVRVIFVQPQFDPTSAKLVAEETGARVETLDPLAEDWEANLRRSARAIAQGLAR